MSEVAESWTCPTHGAWQARGEGFRLQWECPECEAAAEAVVAEWTGSWARWGRWRRSGVPDRFRDASLANFEASSRILAPALRIVRAWADAIDANVADGRGLTLAGPVGLGKTHLLAGLIAKACASGYSAAYATLPEVLSRIKGAIRSPADDPERRLLETLKQVDVLALDEVGLTAPSEFDLATVFELIDHRYGTQLPTLVAGNVTPQSLIGSVGERVADRLAETNVEIVLAGDSYRRKGRERTSAAPVMVRPPESITVTVCDQGRVKERLVKWEQGRARWVHR